MDQKEYGMIAMDADGVYQEERRREALEKITDPDILSDLAMHAVREDFEDENIALLAQAKLHDEDQLLRLALGAYEYEVSEAAVLRMKEDALLLQVIMKTAEDGTKWISPLNEVQDERQLCSKLRRLAIRQIKDVRLLEDAALMDRSFSLHDNGWPKRDTISPEKQLCMIRMAEDKNALLEYAQKEQNARALAVLSKITKDIRIHEILEEKILKEEIAFDADTEESLRENLLMILKNQVRWRLLEGRRTEELWHRFETGPEWIRKKADQRTFAYDVYSRRSGGWESVCLQVDEKSHCLEISDIGPDTRAFEQFVSQLQNMDYDSFSWYSEPGSWNWFLARRDPYLYAEIPGFEEGVFLNYETFRKEVLKDWNPEDEIQE